MTNGEQELNRQLAAFAASTKQAMEQLTTAFAPIVGAMRQSIKPFPDEVVQRMRQTIIPVSLRGRGES